MSEQSSQEPTMEEILASIRRIISEDDAPAEAAAAPAPEPEQIQGFSREQVADNLVGDHAASLAATAFGSLSSALLMPKDGRTLEDVVRELLRPLLKEWLDQNLPRIVEAKVEEEVHRIARGRSV